MSFNLENSHNDEVNEVPEVDNSNEQLTESDESAEDFEDCALNEAQDSNVDDNNQELVEEPRETYDDCENNAVNQIEATSEGNTDDDYDDFDDCGKYQSDTSEEYISETEADQEVEEATAKDEVSPEAEEIAAEGEVLSESEEVAAEDEVPSDTDEVTAEDEVPPEIKEVTDESEVPPEAEEVASEDEVPSETEEVAVETEVPLETEEVTEEDEAPSETEEVAEEDEVPSETEEVTDESEMPPEAEKVAAEDEVSPETEGVSEEDEVPPEAEEAATENEVPPETEEVTEEDEVPPETEVGTEEDEVPSEAEVGTDESEKPPVADEVAENKETDTTDDASAVEYEREKTKYEQLTNEDKHELLQTQAGREKLNIMYDDMVERKEAKEKGMSIEDYRKFKSGQLDKEYDSIVGIYNKATELNSTDEMQKALFTADYAANANKLRENIESNLKDIETQMAKYEAKPMTMDDYPEWKKLNSEKSKREEQLDDIDKILKKTGTVQENNAFELREAHPLSELEKNAQEKLTTNENTQYALAYVEKESRNYAYPDSGPDALDKSEEEIITAQLDQVFANCDFCSRVQTKNLIDIIRSGEIHSQTENTGTSNGSYDPELRKSFSVRQYGCEANEKYGYACSFADEINSGKEGSINNYGEIIVNYKKSSVDGKMTYYLGDSLAANSAGMDSHLGIVGGENGTTTLSGSMNLYNQQLLEVAKTGSVNPSDYVGDRNYLEVQFLGELSTKDISSIGFLHKEDYDNLPEDVKERLRDEKIAVVFPGSTDVITKKNAEVAMEAKTDVAKGEWGEDARGETVIRGETPQSLKERMQDALKSDSVTVAELRQLQDEGNEKLRQLQDARHAAEQESQQKFAAVSTMPRGTDDFKKALQEYNTLQDQKMMLDEQVADLKNQQALLEDKENSAHQAQQSEPEKKSLFGWFNRKQQNTTEIPAVHFGDYEVDSHGFIKGENYQSYIDDWEGYSADRYKTEIFDQAKEQTISPSLVEGIRISDNDIENPNIFWSQHEPGGTAASFEKIAADIPEVRDRLAAGESLNTLMEDPRLGRCAAIYFHPDSMPEVIKCGDYYEFQSNGRHRILAARNMGYDIPVKVVGERTIEVSGLMDAEELEIAPYEQAAAPQRDVWDEKEWGPDPFKPLDMPPKSTSDSQEYSFIVASLEKANVEYRTIQLAEQNRTPQDIIDKLSGGDLTKGSCSSLALAYAGNKAGYNVLDFRDGNSRQFFSSRKTIQMIADMPDIKSTVLQGTDDITTAKQLLSCMQDGKEYYLATGGHAAIVRRNGNDYQYLELQHPSNGNGWHTLSENILRNRFGCKDTRPYACANFLMEVDSMADSAEFRDILGFINTAETKQRKGVAGNVR